MVECALYIEISIYVAPGCSSFQAEQTGSSNQMLLVGCKREREEEEVWFVRGRAVISLVMEANRGRSSDQNQKIINKWVKKETSPDSVRNLK